MVIEAAMADVALQVLEEYPGPSPSCRDARWHQGYVKLIVCDDSRSAAIYKAAVSKVAEVYPGAKLEVVDKEEIPSRPQTRVWIPSKLADPEYVLKLIKVSNLNFPTQN